MLSFLLQSGGGGLTASSSSSTQQLGTRVVLVGLAIQLAFFTLFAVLSLHVYRSPRYQSPSALAAHCSQLDLQRVWRCLALTTALIAVRNVYRLAEFAQGYTGYINSHQIFFALLDTTTIIIAFIVYTVWHYGTYLPSASAEVLPKVVELSKAAEVEGLEAV